MGLFGLGLAWRRAAVILGAPAGVGEAVLGGVTLLYLFALLAFSVKVLRRPAVLGEDLRILPGRAGVAAMVLCLYLLSMTAIPYAPDLARAVLYAGFAAHAALVLLLAREFRRGPVEQRRVTPVWHLPFAGVVLGALAATMMERDMTALVLFGLAALAAAFIWSVSLEQAVKESVPAPLRPLLAIHLAPVALLGLVANALGLEAVALGLAGIAALMVLWMVLRAKWMLCAGFGPLWGALTFPMAATASLWLSVGELWRYPGALLLVAATLVIPWIAFRLLRLWARGQLAITTNAATA